MRPEFVIQEHHARALHWDFRLEHDGVLVSWALPKGIPEDPKTNHLAVHTEDHPLDYGSFEGEIPAGEYGGGRVTIWDRGDFDLEKWTDTEVMVVLHGSRVSGRYVLFPTQGKNWMIHRMDPAPEDFHPLPEKVRPMLATPGRLPGSDEGWAYEIKWDGVRAITFVEGGRIRMQSRNDKELAPSFPEFREIGLVLGSRPCVLDGEIVVIGESGIPDFGRLQHRLHLASASAIAKQSAASPASYVIFDLLHLDGQPLFSLPYDARREQLEAARSVGFVLYDGEIPFATPREATSFGPRKMRAWKDSSQSNGARPTCRASGANRGSKSRMSGRRRSSSAAGPRAREVGRGVSAPSCWAYRPPTGCGSSGRSEPGSAPGTVSHSMQLLRPDARKKSPFVPAADVKDPSAHFVRPRHVGEVGFSEWTAAGHLRHPTWRGLRDDKGPADVVVEASEDAGASPSGGSTRRR